ncbi:hypothetical protein [Halorubrum sp. GN11_10-6_MGM]|nr:hypothetical protein [Halorubrum sp. GN11_10-6_MGM]
MKYNTNAASGRSRAGDERGSAVVGGDRRSPSHRPSDADTADAAGSR